MAILIPSRSTSSFEPSTSDHVTGTSTTGSCSCRARYISSTSNAHRSRCCKREPPHTNACQHNLPHRSVPALGRRAAAR